MKNKLQTVTWFDACQGKVDSELLKEIIKTAPFIDGEDLLAINTTYGKVVELKKVILIIHEESTSGESDVTRIPKGWVKSIK